MKLSELKKIMKEVGFYEKSKDDSLYIFETENDVNTSIIYIKTKYQNKLFIENKSYCDDKIFKAIEASIEFAKTPLHERIDILDDVERKYLHTFINPWRNKIDHIRKERLTYNPNLEYITILINFNKGFNIFLPYFKKGKMYKNMKLNKEYNLEELGV